MREVTDPNLLAELNGTPAAPKEVVDPALLAQLNGEEGAAPMTFKDRIANALQGANSEQGFFEQQRQRGVQSADLDQIAAEGGYNQQVSQLHKIGQLGAGVNDAIGGMLGGAYDTLMTDKGKENINAQMRRIAATPAGQAGIAALQKGGEIWDTYKQANPQTADIIGSAANIGTAALGLGGVSKATGALGDVVGSGGAVVAGGALKSAPIATSADITALSNKAYKTAEDLGGTLKPEFTNKFVSEIEAMKPQSEIGKIMAGDSSFTKLVEKIQTIKDKPISLSAAQEFDELLGDAIDNSLDTGRMTKESRKILEIQNQFRSGIESADKSLITGGKEGFEALKEGRRLWSASRKLNDVERILARAELTDNPATSIKAGFRNLVSNPTRARGYSKKEIDLMRRAAKTGIVSDFLRVTLGSRLIPIITAASGGGMGASAIAAGASMAARGGAEKIAVKRASDVAKEISKRAINNQGE